MFSFSNVAGIKSFLMKAFRERAEVNNRSNVMQYSRKNLTRLMADELDKMTQKKK
jgi:hypothetical protein